MRLEGTKTHVQGPQLKKMSGILTQASLLPQPYPQLLLLSTLKGKD